MWHPMMYLRIKKCLVHMNKSPYYYTFYFFQEVYIKQSAVPDYPLWSHPALILHGQTNLHTSRLLMFQ